MLKSVLNLRLPQSITGGAQEKGNLDTLQACCCKTQVVSLPWMPLAARFFLTFHSSNTEKSGNKTFRNICRYITPYRFLYELSADLQRSLFLSKFCKRVLGRGGGTVWCLHRTFVNIIFLSVKLLCMLSFEFSVFWQQSCGEADRNRLAQFCHNLKICLALA